MNNKTFIRRTMLPAAVICSVLTFNPYTALAASSPLTVSEADRVITGIVLDETGETVTGAKVSTAAEALNVVRKRAGQPDMQSGLSLEQFTKKYENERFVELAFEGHRFYDVRRWKKGAEYFTTIRKMTIEKNGDGSLTFTPETLETRRWNDRMNLFPIAQSEILKSKLTQNPGW